MAFILIYVTHQNSEEANKITSHLLEKKWIACGNCFPITSSYWWKASIAKETEFVSILKTRTENWELVKNEIETIHPYQVPCIMKLDVEANSSYEQWIHAETISAGDLK